MQLKQKHLPEWSIQAGVFIHKLSEALCLFFGTLLCEHSAQVVCIGFCLFR